MTRALTAALLAAAAAALGACGDDENGSGDASSRPSATTRARSPTIYSSVPLSGRSGAEAESAVNGMVLALEQADGRAGEREITFVSLDSATAESGIAQPDLVRRNAQRAANDPNALAYLGEQGSGSSQLSVPITNAAGLLQVSATNTYVGLTTGEGAQPGEPQRYFPSGKRTFARVVPNDSVQARAQVKYQSEAGCRTLTLVDDGSTYGRGLAALVARAAPGAGLQVGRRLRLDPRTNDAARVGAQAAAAGADCMFFGGTAENDAAALFSGAHQASPDMRLFGPDAVAESDFAEALPGTAEAVTYLTTPTLDPSLYNDAGREFHRVYQARFGGLPEPSAIFAYVAMQSVLRAIDAAGERGNQRGAVVDAYFGLRNVDSPVGRFSIDPNGDTTLSTYGGQRIAGGALVFDRVLDAGEGAQGPGG